MTTQKNKRGTHRVPTEHGESRGSGFAFEPNNWQCVAIMIAVVFLFFHEILLGRAWLWEDMLYYSYPVRSFAATSMAAGQMPLWNPYTFNGMPFFADIQTAVLYLPLTILALFVKNAHLSFYSLEVVVILHFVVAGVTMFFLAQSFGLKRIPSLFAGLVYMLSGFMIVHAIHQQIITLVAWYPLVFMLFRKSLHAATWIPVFLCALVLGHSTLAGYPQLSLYLYFFLFLYFIFELFTTHKGAGILSRPALLMCARAGTIVALSITVAMIQLLPTAELADLSQRAQITYEKASEGSLAWSQLLTLVYPKLFGSAGANGYHYWGPGTYWYYWETCVYVGTLPLLLMLLSFPLARRNSQVAFFIGVAVFVLLFALGNNFLLHKLFYEVVPGFEKFRNPARMGIWFSFAAALLSSFAMQSMMSGLASETERGTWKKIVLGITGAGTLLGILIVSGSLSGIFTFMSDQSEFQVVRKETLISLMILLVSGATLFAMLKSRTGNRAFGFVLVLIFVVDMLHFNSNQNTANVDPEQYFQRASNIVQFLKKQGESEIFRVNTRNPEGMIMDRNQGMMDRIATMEGYTPLLLQRVYAPYRTGDQTFDLLNVKYKTVTDHQTNSLALVPHPSYMPRAFFLYKIHVAENESALVAYLKGPEFNHRATAVLEKDPGWAVTTPDTPPVWKANITGYENNRIVLDVETSHDGLLVLSEIYYPGWKAFVDGVETEIFRTDYNLRSIHVTAGPHTVEFRFEPASYRLGSFVTLASLLVCGIGISVPLLKNNRIAHQQAST